MSGSCRLHREQYLGAAALILALLLSACAPSPLQPHRLTDRPTRQATDDSLTQPVLGHSPFDVRTLQETVTWYNQYHIFAPDDLLGLKRLAEVCTALEKGRVDNESCRKAALRVSDSTFYAAGNSETLDLKLETSPAEVLREALEARTDDRRIAAELLGVPVQNVELGSNLVGNGGIRTQGTRVPFESSDQGPEYGLLPGWSPHTWANREPFERALFTWGVDDFALWEQGTALEIAGLWTQSDESRESARHGLYSDEILFESGSVYMFSFYYRTTGVRQEGESSSVRVKDVVPSEYHLSPTLGQWRHVVLLARSSKNGAVQSRLLLRSWVSGDVQFGQVVVKKVFVEGGNILHSEVLAATK
jgi:hypothetical protein